MVAMCTWFNPDNPNLSRSREDGIGGWADLQKSGIKDFPSWFDKLTMSGNGLTMSGIPAR